MAGAVPPRTRMLLFWRAVEKRSGRLRAIPDLQLIARACSASGDTTGIDWIKLVIQVVFARRRPSAFPIYGDRSLKVD